MDHIKVANGFKRGVQIVKDLLHSNKRHIVELLQWDDYKYAAFQYEFGLLWLKLEVKDPFVIDQFERSRIFWNWWKVEWHKRDVEMLNSRFAIQKFKMSTRLQIYHDLHDPHHLIAEGYLDDSYAQIINLITHESKKDKGDRAACM
ncbi:hypothetical protein D3C72_434490 [compost metagenome]